MREKNKAEMTIQEQIRHVADRVCTEICKWPDQWDADAEGVDLSDSEHCANCPLNEL